MLHLQLFGALILIIWMLVFKSKLWQDYSRQIF